MIFMVAASVGFATDWPKITLASPSDAELGGALGEALQRGVERLSQDPYTADWVLADVSLKVGRIFTNYSGDVSGRFLELAALTSSRGRFLPAVLSNIVESITSYQRPDGHFGCEVDLAKPLVKNAPPILLLWGNARLLIGLVTAARELNDAKLLAAAKRLGDYYVNTANQLCATNREAEYHSSGTYGESYTCCYFPAIEGLTMLYRATKDERYLQQAQRMEKFFRKFDELPIDHSHGNLCVWRSILDLYEITGDRSYLDRARAKWDAAVNGGFVWPIGGVGEHWYTFFNRDEGCSESDWLRFNLDLWRLTGGVRYLEMAERLLENQYAANQCANGGFGVRRFDGDTGGPIGTSGGLEEWNFCCSFHGPLGLYFLKAYLAAGSEHDIYVNFPFNFSVPVKVGNVEWCVSVKTNTDSSRGHGAIEIEVIPDRTKVMTPVTVWLRLPTGAVDVRPKAVERGGYLLLKRDCKHKEKITVNFDITLGIEARRFQSIRVPSRQISRLSDVSLLFGPKVLFATPAAGAARANLLATVDASGRVDLLHNTNGGFASMSLPSLDVTETQILTALKSAQLVTLRSWSDGLRQRRSAFAYNLVIVPANLIPSEDRACFAARVGQTKGPFYGAHLETKPDVWQNPTGWKFTPEGLLVAGGDIGLLGGEGYADYRFEFDVQLPKDGQGITGWIVRAQGEGDCLMFQLQSADSIFNKPDFETKPNTLRPRVRHNGNWTIRDPVALPKQIHRGETHHIAVECRADRIVIFLDGEKIHERNDAGLRTGSVGFRSYSPAEQGLFKNVTLHKLP